MKRVAEFLFKKKCRLKSHVSVDMKKIYFNQVKLRNRVSLISKNWNLRKFDMSINLFIASPASIQKIS